LASELECRKADPSAPAKRAGRTNRATRPDAPENGAEEKSGRFGRDDNSLKLHEVEESELGEAGCAHEN
jgi:hypothetical protein